MVKGIDVVLKKVHTWRVGIGGQVIKEKNIQVTKISYNFNGVTKDAEENKYTAVLSVTKGSMNNYTRAFRLRQHHMVAGWLDEVKRFEQLVNGFQEKLMLGERPSYKDIKENKERKKYLDQFKKELKTEQVVSKEYFDNVLAWKSAERWATLAERNKFTYESLGSEDFFDFFDKKFPSGFKDVKARKIPYGVTKRHEQNQAAIFDALGQKLPSYKKSKKAMVKAAKHNYRFQLKEDTRKQLVEHYDVDTYVDSAGGGVGGMLVIILTGILIMS